MDMMCFVYCMFDRRPASSYYNYRWRCLHINFSKPSLCHTWILLYLNIKFYEHTNIKAYVPFALMVFWVHNKIWLNRFEYNRILSKHVQLSSAFLYEKIIALHDPTDIQLKFCTCACYKNFTGKTTLMYVKNKKNLFRVFTTVVVK